MNDEAIFIYFKYLRPVNESESFPQKSMTNIIIPIPQIVSVVLSFCKNAWASSLAALNLLKMFNTDSLPCPYPAEVVLHSPKHEPKSKIF